MPEATIAIVEDGPYFVEGEIALTDDGGRELDLPYDVQLCSWGHYENQPFGDGTNTAIDFDGTLAN